MCRSMVDIHSATAEIRRGKKKKEERYKKPKGKNIMSTSATHGGHNYDVIINNGSSTRMLCPHYPWIRADTRVHAPSWRPCTRVSKMTPMLDTRVHGRSTQIITNRRTTITVPALCVYKLQADLNVSEWLLKRIVLAYFITMIKFNNFESIDWQ